LKTEIGTDFVMLCSMITISGSSYVYVAWWMDVILMTVCWFAS